MVDFIIYYLGMKRKEIKMAAIDKIYGSTQEYDEFYTWLREHEPEFTKHFYPRNGYKNNMSRPITNFPMYVDKWLMANCPIEWVKERILEQYNGNI
jgi:hypothetical protein